MNVREMMSVHPTCVSRRTKIVDAARLMAEAGVGALPVCDEKRVVGIVTDRDIVLRSVAERPASPLVESVMTLSPYTIDVHAPLERAEALMAQHQIRRLPVCEHGRIVGMLSQADLARRASHEEVGTLLEAISS